MTEMTMQNLPFVGHSLRRGSNSAADASRLADLNAAFLRRLYPTHTRDRVARDTGTSPDTVRRWLDESQAPSACGIARLAAAYGVAWVDAVVLRLADDHLERQKHDLARQRAELDARQRLLDAQLERAGKGAGLSLDR